MNRESAQSTSRSRSAEIARQEELLRAMQSVQAGDFSVRVCTDWESIHGKLADAFNDIIAANERMASELERVGYGVGKQGKTKVRFSLGGRGGAWEHMEGTVNTLIEDLLWPTQDVTRIIAAVAKGDLSQTMSLEVEGRPLEGAFLRSANIVNTMIAQLSVFSSEVTRVAREFGTEGKLGGQATVPGVADTWKELTDQVNSMASNLTAQVRNIAEANEALQMEKTREVHKLNQSLTAANIDLARSNRSLQVEILERRNVEDRLRQADRRKDEFLATLAHELRNPLAPIQGALNVRRLSRGEDNDELQEVMERQMRHMVRLVDDLLDVSRITRDRLELRPEPVEMAQVVAVARETVQPLLDAAGQSLLLDMPEEPLRLYADPHRLAQVFANLLSNASKFSEPGSAITMRIAADGDGDGDGDSVEVAVRDQGIGIAREKLRDIFEMFTQADPSLERARGGLGIGLSLSRRLAEMHGGQLSARSDGPGQGSEFCVRLPLRAGETAAEPQRAEPPAAPAQSGQPLRVLVVDDNRDSADMLALSLKLMGHEVMTLYDPLDVLAAARSWQPDLAFLDVGMPVLNGFSLAQQLRAETWPDGRGPRLVALTGWGQEEDRRRSEQAGFDEHLVKPADLETIERVCRDAVAILDRARAAAH